MFLFNICAVTFKRVTGRKRSEFCKKYKSDYFGNSGDALFPAQNQTDKCWVGSYDKAKDDERGLSTVNLIRWATGYNNILGIENSFHPDECACATLTAAVGHLNHYPKDTEPCFTTSNMGGNAHTGCSTSNLAAGPRNTASAIRLYYHDDGVDSLGHRYWLLYNQQKVLSFCGIGIYSAARTVSGYRDNVKIGGDDFPFVAAPPPGPIATTLMTNIWSFYAPYMCKTPEITVKLNGKKLNIKSGPSEAMGGFIKWTPDIPNKAAVNATYDVDLKCSNVTYSYSIYTTDCSEDISDYSFDAKVGRKSNQTAGEIAGPWIIFVLAILAIIGIGVAIAYKKTDGFKNLKKSGNDEGNNDQKEEKKKEEKKKDKKKDKKENTEA